MLFHLSFIAHLYFNDVHTSHNQDNDSTTKITIVNEKNNFKQCIYVSTFFTFPLSPLCLYTSTTLLLPRFQCNIVDYHSPFQFFEVEGTRYRIAQCPCHSSCVQTNSLKVLVISAAPFHMIFCKNLE